MLMVRTPVSLHLSFACAWSESISCGLSIGFNIGRYWLEPSSGCSDGACAPPDFPGPLCYFRYKGCGRPTQHLYHVPTELLKERHNLVVLFEENSNVQARRVEDVSLVVLHEHPPIN